MFTAKALLSVCVVLVVPDVQNPSPDSARLATSTFIGFMRQERKRGKLKKDTVNEKKQLSKVLIKSKVK